MSLWPHQDRGLNELDEAIAAGETKICVTSPTGGGKSRMMFEWIKRGGRSTAIYTDRRMLCEQLSENMTAHGISHGIIASGFEPSIADIQLCMAQTMVSKCVNGLSMVPNVERCIWDEAHKMGGATLLALREQHWRAIDVAFTATPLGIGHIYEKLIIAGTNSELRECGALVPAFHYGPDEPDVKWVGTVKVDDGECGIPTKKRQEFAHRVFGRVVENYLEINSDRRPTVLFAPGVAESIWFAQELCKNGIPAAHIDGENVWLDGELHQKDRDVIEGVKEMLADGTLSVVCNRFVLREGIDWPFVEHLIFATVFGSLTSYLQAGGRGLRASPGTGKTKCCLARGTPILTDRGLVPIQDVTKNDLVWDGVEFCSHDGPACNGTKEVIEWNGIQLTHDHKVLTNDGWKQAEEAKSGGWRPVIGGVGRTPVRTTDDSNPYDSREGRQVRGSSGLFSMWRAGMEVLSQDIQACSSWLRTLHEQVWGSLSGMGVEACSASETAMSMPAKQHVPSLRRSWHRVSFYDNLRSCLLDSEASWNTRKQGNDSGPDRQRGALRTWQLAMGISRDAIKKSGLRMAMEIKARLSIRAILGWKPVETSQERLESTTDSRPLAVEVWDIVNAGPRNRYCANGLIVANCIQDHGGNWHRHGSLNSDRVWELGWDDKIVAGMREKRLREKKELEPIVCPKCHAVRLSGPKCFSCGHQHNSKVRLVLQQNGSLKEMSGDIYRARRTAKKTEDLEKAWTSRVRAVRNSQKETVRNMTFAQLEVAFARDHKWAYPPHDMASMPTCDGDWFLPVRAVAEDRLS